MHIRSLVFAWLALPALLGGCATVSEQAPEEVKAAQASLKKAKSVDVEDYMPSALEAAQRKFDKSVSLLGNDGKRDEAISLANQSKAISDNAIQIVSDMHAFDRNSGEYISAADRRAKAAELEQQLAAANARVNELEGKYNAAEAQNKELANRPAKVEETIPSDFRVGKPVAYFSTGSTTLAARYRSDVHDLARFLGENKELEVTLEGFADPRGSASLNKSLAERRVQAVADELKAQGVPADRIKQVTVGATDDRSTARNNSAGQLQLDRKVNATVTKIAH
jgi:outer membrane protein OmpA-like peptidoglycan-associated protein